MTEKPNSIFRNILQASLLGLAQAESIPFASEETRLEYLESIIIDMIRQINQTGALSYKIEGLKINSNQVIIIEGAKAKVYDVSEAEKLQKRYLALTNLNLKAVFQK